VFIVSAHALGAGASNGYSGVSGGQKAYEGCTYVDLAGASIDLLNNVVGVLAVNSAANGLSSAEDFLDGAGHGAGHGADAHLLSNVVDLVEGDVAIVLD